MKKITLMYLSFLITILFIASQCKKEIKSLPIVTTSSVTSIKITSASGRGNISSDGNSEIIAKGLCWNTLSNPTIADSKTIDGSGTGIFNNEIINLTANTKYYLRAYATNSIGTAYGNEVSFKTAAVGDIDGNYYQSVTIGSQVWMAENLKVTKFSNGTNIPNVTDNSAWRNLSTPAYSWYDNNPSYKNVYGALYNWYCVINNNLCPTGWHVPSKEEWQALVFSLGQASAGGKLKETGTAHWTSPNTGATNETKFTALPAGTRLNSDGTFQDLHNVAIWWSTTIDVNNAWYLYSIYNASNITWYYSNKTYGNSIRCIKD